MKLRAWFYLLVVTSANGATAAEDPAIEPSVAQNTPTEALPEPAATSGAEQTSIPGPDASDSAQPSAVKAIGDANPSPDDETTGKGPVASPADTHESVDPTAESLLSEDANAADLPAPLAPTPERDPIIDAPAMTAAERVAMLQRQVSAIEAEYGALDGRLAEVLANLGTTFHTEGRYVDATDAFDKAQHVTRVNDGLHNLQQVDILARKAESLAALGRWPEATAAQVYAYRLEERAHGEHLPLLPAIARLGDWYRRSGDVIGARNMHQAYVEILTNETSPTDLRRAEGLINLATAYRLERFPEHRFNIEPEFTIGSINDLSRHEPPLYVQVNRFAPGEAALKEAIRIYQAQQPANHLQTADALLQLGDWYLMFEKYERSTAAYREAFELVKAQHPEQLEPLFSAAKLIYLRPPLAPLRPGSFDVPEYRGFVMLRHDIDERGHVRNVEVTAAEPKELMDISTVKAFRAARFRPRFDAEGNAQVTAGMTYRHDFTYFERREVASRGRQADMPEATPTSPPASVNETPQETVQ